MCLCMSFVIVVLLVFFFFFFFSSRRRHTRCSRDWSSDVCSSDLFPNLRAIRTQKLARRFGNLTAVDGIDLQVAAGQFFGFLGPNGAGKSTTIKMRSEERRVGKECRSRGSEKQIIKKTSRIVERVG